MKSFFLATAFLLSTGSNMLNSNDDNSKNIITNEDAIVYDCGDFADAVAHDAIGDYWTVWFRAYGQCLEFEREQLKHNG